MTEIYPKGIPTNQQAIAWAKENRLTFFPDLPQNPEALKSVKALMIRMTVSEPRPWEIIFHSNRSREFKPRNGRKRNILP